MGDVTGFLKHGRELPARRPVPVRLRDWREVYEPFPAEAAQRQGARCMDCGIPFCQEGCPLGNLIPEWNDLVYRDDWSDAIERLHATNNFPEFTGRLCPAPCEGSCVLGINDDPVAIERIEYEIVERAWSEGWVAPVPRRCAPASRWRWWVRDRPGWPRPSSSSGPATGWWCSSGPRSPAGCSGTGSPSSRWRRRCSTGGSTRWRPRGSSSVAGCRWGSAHPRSKGPWPPTPRWSPPAALVDEFDSVLLAGGATLPRDLSVPGRELAGIHRAMDYLKPSNLVQEGLLAASPISAEGKHVVIIGGGDTGADCLGTVHRQRALSVHQLEIMPEPPAPGAGTIPGPPGPPSCGPRRPWRRGGAALLGDHGGVRRTTGTGTSEPSAGPRSSSPTGTTADPSSCRWRVRSSSCPASWSCWPWASSGRSATVWWPSSDWRSTPGAAWRPTRRWSTNVEGVFVCGDMTRGQSLIVWAIAEGRSAASSVDRYLMGVHRAARLPSCRASWPCADRHVRVPRGSDVAIRGGARPIARKFRGVTR